MDTLLSRLLLLFLFCLFGTNILVAETPTTHRVHDKLRILVDKVVSYKTQPHVTDSQVQEISAAGFNVLVPRWGGHDIAIVREGATLAQKHGMMFMPWIRGSSYTRDTTQMMVWRDGVVGKKALTSPNSDQLWNSITATILGHARLSTKNPSIIGTFVDFENYDTHGGYGHCYPLSYDQMILARFAQNRGVDVPSLPREDRYAWLKKNGHHEAFASFQIGEWRRRCRNLRTQIDAINPKFRLAIYPVPGPLFVTNAALHHWSTNQAPLILADASTYGRPMRFVSEQASLLENKRKLLDHINYLGKTKRPFDYVGGIDPIVEPGNPEFFGKNADMIASIADGYWVFYEGPTHGKQDHKTMFEWFARANRSIKERRFNLQYQERETPEPQIPHKIERTDSRPLIVHEGINIGLHKEMNRHGSFRVRFLESLSPQYLRQADIVIIQSAIRWIECDSRLTTNLRNYVEKGGSLLLTNLGWCKTGCAHHHGRANGFPILNIHEPPTAQLFPQVARWSAANHAAAKGRFVLDNQLVVTNPTAISSGLPAEIKFNSNSPNHMVLRSGPDGRIVVKDAFGDTVCVVGKYGRGKVILSGCNYGFWTPGHRSPFGSKHERELYYAMLDWLADKE